VILSADPTDRFRQKLFPWQNLQIVLKKMPEYYLFFLNFHNNSDDNFSQKVEKLMGHEIRVVDPGPDLI
jgi:hypothetical protein